MKLKTPVTFDAEVQTPVFIWDGDTTTPLSFVLDGAQVHVIDGDRFIRAFSPEGQEAYLDWLDPRLAQLADLETQLQRAGDDRDLRQQLNREKRDMAGKLSVEQFIRQRLRKPPGPFVRALGCVAYSVRAAVTPGNDGFRGFIKAAGYRPYVPGTELKGAWRTALLYALAGHPDNYAVLEHALTDFRNVLNSGQSPREKNRRLTQISGQLEETALRGKKNDAKYDLLRLMQVNDGALLSPKVLQIQSLESVGTQRFTRTLAEALEPGTKFTFRLILADVAEVRWALAELGLETVAADFSVAKLLEVTYQRSKAILDADAAYFKQNPQMRGEITQLQAANTPQSPLLRLGSGQGFLSTTVDLNVRDRDPNLYDQAIREGVSLQRRWRTQRNNFPKTRRVVSDGRGNPVTVPGWIKLQIRTEET